MVMFLVEAHTSSDPALFVVAMTPAGEGGGAPVWHVGIA